MFCLQLVTFYRNMLIYENFFQCATSPLPSKDSVRKEMVIEFQDIISLKGEIDKITKEGKAEGFMVDSEVSKKKYQGKGERRELQKWSDTTITTAFDSMALESDNVSVCLLYTLMNTISTRKNDRPLGLTRAYNCNQGALFLERPYIFT